VITDDTRVADISLGEFIACTRTMPSGRPWRFRNGKSQGRSGDPVFWCPTTRGRVTTFAKEAIGGIDAAISRDRNDLPLRRAVWPHIITWHNSRTPQSASPMKPRRISTGPSALSAYRSDLPLGTVEPEAQEADGELLLIAALIRSAVSATPTRAARDRILTQAAGFARITLGPVAIARGCRFSGGRARSRLDLFRLVAEQADQAGKLKVAQNILDALEPLAEHPRHSAQILADRARNARKRGDVALATAQYRELLKLGRSPKLVQFQAAAYVGLGALAQMRGNFTEMRSLATKGLRIAERNELNRIAATAHAGLGHQAALRKDLSGSITHLWRAYLLSAGDPHAQHEFLANLAHAFVLAGCHKEARIASRAALHGEPSIRIALPALGTFAVASAALGVRDDAEWAEQHVRRLAKSRGHYREIAQALAECASALELLGQSARAGVLRRRAEALAVKHEFFDLTFRTALNNDLDVGARATLGKAAVAAAHEVEQLEDELPSTLELMAVA
jgi:tetratricopeptide (TPR) repeat protein